MTRKPYQFSSVQSLSHVRLFATPWTAAHQVSLSINNSQSLLKFMSIESVMPSNHLLLCCPLFLLSSILPRIRVFSNKSVLHIMWPKYWSFSFSISPSNEYSGLISFTIQFSCSIMSSSYATPCMDCSMPGFPVLHQLPQLAQTRVQTW